MKKNKVYEKDLMILILIMTIDVYVGVCVSVCERHNLPKILMC